MSCFDCRLSEKLAVAILILLISAPIFYNNFEPLSNRQSTLVSWNRFNSAYSDPVTFFLIFPTSMFVIGLRFSTFLALVTLILAFYIPMIACQYQGRATQAIILGVAGSGMLVTRLREFEIARREQFLLKNYLEQENVHLQLQVDPFSVASLSTWIEKASTSPTRSLSLSLNSSHGRKKPVGLNVSGGSDSHSNPIIVAANNPGMDQSDSVRATSQILSAGAGAGKKSFSRCRQNPLDFLEVTVKLCKKVGSGGSGQVYAALYGSTQVACKELFSVKVRNRSATLTLSACVMSINNFI